MKTYSSLLLCRGLFLFSRFNRFRHKTRLIAAAFFLMFVGAISSASAQTVSNCVTVICPPPFVTNYTCENFFTPQQYPIIISNRCPNVQVQVNCNPPPGTPLGLGPNPIHCVVSTANGEFIASCDFTIVVVRDTTPPVIQCPSNIVVGTCAGTACGAAVFYPPPTASDNSGSVSVTCTPASGSAFVCGTTPVTCTAEDRCGLKTSCTFNVTVQPNGQPPSLQCPPDITVDTCTNGAVVTFSPTVSPSGTFVSCTPPSGSFFPIGASSVTCFASNSCNSVQCTFKVNVRAVPPASIQCPTNIVVVAPCGSNCVPVFYPSPTVNNGGLQSCNPPSGSCLPVGLHTVICRATNICGQITGCSFEIRVVQSTAEAASSIQCPSNIVVDTCRPNCDVVNYPPPTVFNATLVGCSPPSGSCFPIGVSAVTCVATNPCGSNACSFTITVRSVPPATFQCPTAPVVITAPCGSNCVPVNYPVPAVSNGSLVGCTPPPGTCLPVGVYTVTCTATNRCGQTNACSFNLEVRPNQGQAPNIQCPTNQTFRVPCNTNCVSINYPSPIVNNGVLVGCTPPPGTCLPVGDYVVKCTATNNCSSSTCEFIVHVVPDSAQPNIQCPTNIVVAAPCGSNCVPVFYPPPTVGNGAFAGCNPPSGTCFPIGLTTVTCRATNNCGLVSTCQFDVRVASSGQGPVITCPTNRTVTLPCNTNCAVVNYPLPTVSNGALGGCSPPSGTCFSVGNHVVTCFATNNCGSTSCSFTVNVVSSTQPPTIICPTNRIVTLPCGSNCVTVTYPTPTVANGVLAGCTPPSGSCLPVGIYNVVCEATNSCGLKAACEFQIRVVQPVGTGQGPIIQCPSNIVVFAPCGASCAPVTYPAPFVTNGFLESCSVPQNACLPLGTNLVVCRATNNCGTSTCSFTVTVRPGQTQLPIMKCPSNVVATVPCGSNCVPVNYPLPFVTNGVLIGCTPPPGSCLQVGFYNVICTATNACGQTQCEFPLQVVGGQGHSPVITCPSNIVVETCSPNCVGVPYPLPTVFNGTLVGCNPAPTVCFPIGITPVTCVATNPCGSNACTFTVTVRQIPFPQITCPSNIIVTTCSNGAVVKYPAPTVSGVPASAVTCTPPPGSFFPLGTNVVRCCVTDQCNRTNCCEFLIVVLGGNPCVKPPPGMVLWLPLDEPVPPIAANIIPGAPNGGHVNGPVPILGQYVLNSLRFDGIDDFVRVPNYAAIVLSASDLSIDAWIRRDTATADQGRHVIVSKVGQVAGAAGARGYEYYLNNGVMNLFLGGVVAQNFNSGVAVPVDGNWHHVAVTVARGGGGVVRFYIDGAIVNVQGGPIVAPLGNNSSLFVGAGTFPAPNSFFRGAIDEVEIFRRALTPAEVFSLWNAQQAGKCKITCATPMNVPIKPGTCVTVNAQICNNTALPQIIGWTAAGPAVATAQSGSFVLPPFTCTNVPVTLCSPAGTPPNTALPWTFTVFAGSQCPIVCGGSVVTHGIIVTNPNDPTGVPGTNQTARVRVSLNGLPPGSPLRFMAIGPDMEPDQLYVSLNGLPPGVPWELPGVSLVGGKGKASITDGLDVPIRFAEEDPGGHYTIVIEADLDGDGDFEPLSSFAAENSVVPPPTLRIVDGKLWWDDMGDGFGNLEVADSIEGPWTAIPGGPGTPIGIGGSMKFYRVAVPITE